MSDITKQVRLRPVIRVFVSSTFSDMKHERNALAADAFPKLEQLCQRQGFQFQAIDLRWGVSTEAGLDHRTMRICFDELRRAQELSPEPNFLILLGDRYGWRPLPEVISQAEFEKLAAAARTGGEMQEPLPGAHGKKALQVLEEWYRCDMNVALSDFPETDPDRTVLNYILQPRTQNLGDGHNYKYRKDDPTKDTQDWMDVQEVLWRLVNAAFPADERWLDDVDWPQHVADVNDHLHPKRAIPQIVRFQASATEQEIWCGALSAPSAEKHVIACFRKIFNRNDFAATDVNDFFDVVEGGFNAASARRQSDLKAALKQRLGDNQPLPSPFTRLKLENGKMLLDASETDTKAFCDAVFEKVRPIIEHQIEEYWNKCAKDSPARAARELEIEQDEHKRFGRERGGKESFVGRNTELETIRNYLSGDNGWPLVVHGSSGCGKTAFLWRAFEDIPESRKPIIRLIGTTPHSSDLRTLLSSLCEELRQQNLRPEALPTEIKELRNEFSQHLQTATSEQPLILFLDALDQLADVDNGRLLTWLPLGLLPDHVKLVVSCLSDRADDDPAGQPYIELNRRQIPKANFINLDVLSKDEARLLLFDKWLPKAGRKVSDDQRSQIEQSLASPVCRQPIYLKLLFEEVQLWHSYDPKHVLGESVHALLGQLFNRLSLETNHGPLFVNRVLGYLSASRYGLAENEILEILFADPEYRTKLNEVAEKTRHELPPNAKRIPIALWSRLRFDLAPYLTERAAPGANVLTFYHRQVAEWVQEHLSKTFDKKWQPHHRLADYFRNLADPEKNQSWKCDSRRPFGELPFHLVQAHSWAELVLTLEDVFFLEAKVTRGLAFDLVCDFTETVQQLPRDHRQHRILCLLEEALRRDIHFIGRHAQDYPQVLFQCLWNSCWWFDCPEMAQHYEDGRAPQSTTAERLSPLLERWLAEKSMAQPHFPWLRSLRPPIMNLGTPQTLILDGHINIVNCVSFSPNGRIIASGAEDGTLRLWDAVSGAPLAEMHTLGRGVDSFCFSPDGNRIVSSEPDTDTLRIWDLASRTVIASYHRAREHLGNVCYSPDGRYIAGEVYHDNTLRVLDAETGVDVFIIRGHEKPITCVKWSLDGAYLATGSADRTVRIWHASDGQQLMVLKGHEGGVNSVSFAPDGCTIVSGSEDMTLRIWKLEEEKQIAELRGHEDAVKSVSYSPDGRYIASGSYDKTLRIWDVKQKNVSHIFRGHEKSVNSVSFSPNGRFVCSGSGAFVHQNSPKDNTVRVWKLTPSLELLRRVDHNAYVTSVAFSPDGRHLLTTASGEMRVWDVLKGTLVIVIEGSDATTSAWSPCGRYFANGPRVFNAENYKQLCVLKGPSHGIGMVAFSHDGKLLAGGISDGTVRIWDVQSGTEIGVFRGHEITVNCVGFSPDGLRIVSGSGNTTMPDYSDNAVRVWDVNTGAQLMVSYDEDERQIDEVRFSSDGTKIVAKSDMHLYVWDAHTYRSLDTRAIDVSAILDGCETHPLIMRFCVVTEVATHQKIAWLNQLSEIVTAPCGRLWAAVLHRYIALYKLEFGNHGISLALSEALPHNQISIPQQR